MLVVTAALATSACTASSGSEFALEHPALIPLPVSVEWGDGTLAEAPVVTSEDSGIPAEGYRLEVDADGIRVVSADAAGAFYALQTLEQLRADDGSVPYVAIEDHPRFAYRGAMLDVARHFFTVEEVERYIDQLALFKLNHLHLHLTDDQGWRIQIDSWPKLTEVGALTEVGGGEGGFYTKDDYARIVAYAAERFITIVPEIDMPGHTNAAMVAYPELACEGVSPTHYSGIDVGFSTLCIGEPDTMRFVADVVGELAAMTPGPYLHLGGDESLSTTDEDFLAFVREAAAIGAATGKTVIGWHEMGRSSELPAGTIGQYWDYVVPRGLAGEHTLSFARQGGQVILSPANAIYLDMKYDESTPLGLTWADGPTPIRDSYDWEPADVIDGLDESAILGIEAPLWTETNSTSEHLEAMAFPRLLSAAELAWSPRDGRSWDEYRIRLAAFAPFLDAQGIRYTRAAGVPW